MAYTCCILSVLLEPVLLCALLSTLCVSRYTNVRSRHNVNAVLLGVAAMCMTAVLCNSAVHDSSDVQ